MPTITDATVVAQAYDTSGNGGRKITNNSMNIFTAEKSTTQVFLQKYSSTTGNFAAFLTTNVLTSVQDVAIQATDKAVYTIFSNNNNRLTFYANDPNSGAYLSTANLDDAQTALGNVSLAINEAKTELHATWASKNSAYPNSFNIRYAKGTINTDGTVTWGAVEQITQINTSGYEILNLSIVTNNNIPIITAQSTGITSRSGALNMNGTTKAIISLVKNGTTLSGLATGWYMYNVYYNDSSYTQQSPSAIYVPQSINGLANGLLANAWHGTDSASGGSNYIRFSKSTDGGVTWSTMQKLGKGTNATLTANKSGKLFITYEDSGYTQRIESTDNGDTWGSPIGVGSGTNPSSLFDLTMNMTAPLTIRKGTSSVLFSGTWTITKISVTPGDIGQKADKNNILSYSITTDGEMSTITEKVNGTVVNTRNTTSGQAVTLGLTQAQWDAIRFGRYTEGFNSYISNVQSDWDQSYRSSIVGSTADKSTNATIVSLKNSITQKVTSYKVKCDSNYKMFITEVDSSNVVVSSTGWIKSGTTFTTKQISNNLYVMLRKSDVSTITVNDVSTANPTLTDIYSNNTLTVEMGSEKWTYTFDKQLASDADIISASKAVKDANEVYLPVKISRLADVAKGKGAVIPANPKIDDIVTGINTLQTSVYGNSSFTTTSPYTLTVNGLGFSPSRVVFLFYISYAGSFDSLESTVIYRYGNSTSTCTYIPNSDGFSVSTTVATLNNIPVRWIAFR